jgi:hypothetical protein
MSSVSYQEGTRRFAQGSAQPFDGGPDAVESSTIGLNSIGAANYIESIPGAPVQSLWWTRILVCAIYSPSALSLIVAVGLVDSFWVAHSRLSFGGWQSVACIVLVMWLVGFYGSMRGISKLADIGHHMALWVTFLAVNIVFTYLWATLPMPLHDATFARINGVLGFHWAEGFTWIAVRPLPRTLLTAAYGSLFFQILGSVSYLALTDCPDRNRELLWAVMISALGSAVISGLLPATGPFIGSLPDIEVAFLALRSGALLHIDVSQLKGIVTMPSFHTVLAILFTYAHRPPSRSFVPVAILNLVMLVSIPFAGHHYLIDMIAGAALAAATIGIVRWARRASVPRIAVTTGQDNV